MPTRAKNLEGATHRPRRRREQLEHFVGYRLRLPAAQRYSEGRPTDDEPPVRARELARQYSASRCLRARIRESAHVHVRPAMGEHALATRRTPSILPMSACDRARVLRMRSQVLSPFYERLTPALWPARVHPNAITSLGALCASLDLI